MSIHLTNFLPFWAVLLLVAAFLAVLAHGTWVLASKKIPRSWLARLGSLRLLIGAVFLLILLQPVISYSGSTRPLPEMMILVDSSQSMAQTSDKGSGSRLERVTAALQKSGLVKTLHGRYQIHWFSFDHGSYPMEESDLGSLKPVGSTTRFADSISTAWKHLGALGKTPQRLLLVSDGNDLGKSDPAEIARALGLVIDTLGPTAPPLAETPRVEIAGVQCSRRVLLGSETHFRVTLSRTSPARDQTVRLKLTEDGKKVWEQEVKFLAGQAERGVTLAHRPPTTGSKRYEFQIMDAGPDSAPYPQTVQVVDSKYEVLILEDTWRWEFKFLRRLLEDDPSFRFTALLSRGKNSFMQFGSPDRRVNLVGFPQGRTELEGFDAFILGDVDPGRWPANLAPILSHLVTEEGKSLVIIAGPNVGALAEVPELNRLLPVELARDSGHPLAGPINIRFGPDSAGSPFFFQIKESAKDKLPPLDQIYPPVRKKPAATILLEAEKQANSYGKLIVMAEHMVGKGRVLYIGTDTLWKWQTLAPAAAGPTPYSIFWQQAFRALTPARSYQGATQLWLQAGQTRAEVGRPLAFTAEIQSLRPLPNPRIQAAVELPDKRLLPLDFSLDPANPKVFRAHFEPLIPGPYTIKATVLAESKSAADALTEIHVVQPMGELSDKGIDHANLARIAAATGGKVIDPDRPETWPPPVDNLPEVSRERTIDLWNSFILIMVLCGLLGIDWTCRIMKGFV